MRDDLLNLRVVDMDELAASNKGRTPTGPMRLRAVPTGAGVGVPAADPQLPEAQGSNGGSSGQAGGMVGHDGPGGVVTRPGRSIQFTVPGAPVGKGRPIAGKSFGGHTTLRTPAKTVSYENLVGWTAAQAMAGGSLILGAVSVGMVIGCEVPASWSKVKQERALAGRIYPTTKPDIDNVEKAIFDALNGVVWKDDVQVVSVSKIKRYEATPGVRVDVREVA